MQKTFLILFIAFSFGCASTSDSPNISQRVMNEPGIYPSPSGTCDATLTVNPMGGFLTLSVSSKMNRGLSQEINDITGMSWINDENIVFTVSPIYGRPGIYIGNCKSMQISRILGPSTITQAYPEGADYFELKEVSAKDNVIYFYYSPDVDSTDFNDFRTRESLYSVKANGEHFPKIQDGR